MHDAASALDVGERVSGERAPGGAWCEVAEAGPCVDGDGAVVQFGDGVVEGAAERPDGAGVGDEVGAQGAVEPLVGGVDRGTDEACRVLPGELGRCRGRARTTRRVVLSRCDCRCRALRPGPGRRSGSRPDGRRPARARAFAPSYQVGRAGALAMASSSSSRNRCFCGQAAGSSRICAAMQLWPRCGVSSWRRARPGSEGRLLTSVRERR